ncbi:MAG: hypothetical protein HUJ80_00135, partial [Firmicutes bacterium]|nr:hypothetical protein [Bacillota bacterium]
MNPSTIDTILQKVSKERLMTYTAEISKEERISSLPAEVRSLEYIQEQLKESGYKTRILYYPAYISYPVSAFLEVESPAMKGFRAIPACFTPSTGVYGVRGRLALFSDSDLSGKILLGSGLPNLDIILKAEALGAVGAVFV